MKLNKFMKFAKKGLTVEPVGNIDWQWIAYVGDIIKDVSFNNLTYWNNIAWVPFAIGCSPKDALDRLQLKLDQIQLDEWLESPYVTMVMWACHILPMEWDLEPAKTVRELMFQRMGWVVPTKTLIFGRPNEREDEYDYGVVDLPVVMPQHELPMEFSNGESYYISGMAHRPEWARIGSALQLLVSLVPENPHHTSCLHFNVGSLMSELQERDPYIDADRLSMLLNWFSGCPVIDHRLLKTIFRETDVDDIAISITRLIQLDPSKVVVLNHGQWAIVPSKTSEGEIVIVIVPWTW